jgi:enoyl-CoA hydratase/carnithine racemase
MATDEVLYEQDGHVATLTLNRPDRMNTISGPMLQELSRLLIKADADRSVRVIILTGTGRAFCAGLDLQDASQGSGIGGNPGAGGFQSFNLRTSPPTVLHGIDTPTICALNGGAAGYGMDMAMLCDLRVAAESSKLAAAFTKRGIVPESGGTWVLPRMLGWAKASELIFTGRTLGAKECLELGLVNKVVPDAALMDSARELADEIAANAPLAVQASKRMMRMGLDESFDTHVDRVYLQLLPLFRTKDFQEGMASFLQKRKPDFEGR